jgi:hypothetical protein
MKLICGIVLVVIMANSALSAFVTGEWRLTPIALACYLLLRRS